MLDLHVRNVTHAEFSLIMEGMGERYKAWDGWGMFFLLTPGGAGRKMRPWAPHQLLRSNGSLMSTSRLSFLRFRICPVLTGWKGLWNTGWRPNSSTPETCA